MATEMRVKKYTCPDCGVSKCPTHHRTSCSGVIAYNYGKDRWECTKCKKEISGGTYCTNCDRRLDGYVNVVRRVVR